MFPFQKSLPQLNGRAVLLSIKPKYADLILRGAKRVEFRRSWATHEVSVIVLYSSAPIQKLVGIVEVEDVVIASPSALWKTCTERGGGLTRAELRTYFSGKSQGVAVLLGEVFKFSKHLDPTRITANFVPPQSFRYMELSEYNRLEEETKINRRE